MPVKSRGKSAGYFSKVLEEIEFEEEVKEAIEDILKRRLKIHWADRLPVIGGLSGRLASKFKDIIAKEMIKAAYHYKGVLVDKFHSRVDLQKMVAERVEGYDLEKLEKIIKKLVAIGFLALFALPSSCLCLGYSLG